MGYNKNILGERWGDLMANKSDLDWKILDSTNSVLMVACSSIRRLRRMARSDRDHGVIEPVMGQALVALNARIAERGVFITPEGEHSLIHMLSVEHLEPHK